MARGIIEQLLDLKGPAAQLYNLNIPTVAIDRPQGIKVVPMGVQRYGENYIKRTDPKGRTYYWATNEPPPRAEGHETDLTALTKGFVSLTPLQYNMTKQPVLTEMEHWRLSVPAERVLGGLRPAGSSPAVTSRRRDGAAPSGDRYASWRAP